ncbi:MAG: SDR family oxidoreductase [Salinibacterium sp.]|nr:SDR family oxidoreductase [Salinibacterium sp.]
MTTEAPLRTVVTGAASGIGHAIAELLRKRGDTVIGIDREPGDAIVVAELSEPGERARAVTTVIQQLGGVDVLVNVAGVYRAGSIHNSGFGDWRAVWSVNLDAPLDLMRMVTPGMIEQRFGRIVNITSVHGAFAQPASLAYDVSKAGLEAATRSVALDLAAHGVLANAVAPGFVRTRMSLLADGTDETDTEAFRARYFESGRLPLGRGALASEIAPAVAFLTDRSNTYITGQSLAVDGGLTMTF